MVLLTEQQVAELLEPYLSPVAAPADLYPKIVTFVELVLRWNARTNLTAVREPIQLVQRQVGESLYAARLLQSTASLLDVGSGAGFPGIPLKLMLPHLQVTLAESQGKKASFLREAARVLGLDVAVWPHRVETLPAEQRFEVVAMRAVDDSATVLSAAEVRVADEGSLMRYVSAEGGRARPGWQQVNDLPIPLSAGRLLRLTRV